MRKLVLLAMVVLVVPAMAGTLTADPGRPHYAGGASGGMRGDVVYDNTVNGPIFGFSDNPNALIADDLTLDYSLAQGNILEDLAFVVYNSSNSTTNMDGCDVDITIFNFDPGLGTYVYNATLTFTGLTPGLTPGYFTTYYADGLCPLGIALSDDILLGIQIYNVAAGVLPGTIGYDPPVWGLSADIFWMDQTVATPPGTAVGWYWFGGPPYVANFYWGVSTCPEPTSLVLLALGGLTLVRRR
jgi:hypothetical protein